MQKRELWFIDFIMYKCTCTCSIRNADVHLSVEAAEPTQRRVDAVGSVGGCHDDDVGPLLEPVHQSQQLGHDAALHLTVRLVERETHSVHTRLLLKVYIMESQCIIMYAHWS